ncbi:MAG: VOC family protein [Pseudomonadota bacterium]
MVVPSLFAPDLNGTLAFFVDVLGFDQTGIYPDTDNPIWAEVTFRASGRGSKIWFFSQPIADRPAPAMSGVIYIFVDDVDAFCQSLADKVSFRWGPETMDYGLREVGIEDPNGYLLAFAQDA